MENKTVLVTGAARRIGAAVARDLHKHDMDIVIHYNTSAAAARELVQSLNQDRPDSAFLLQGDLMHAEGYADIIEKTQSFTGRLDVLVNNASQFYPTEVGSTSLAQWEAIMATNLKAPYFLSQAAAGQLARQSGCIVNITDIHGLKPLKGYPVYSAAKAGLLMLTQALARELAPAVRVNAVSPGPILWPEGMGEDMRREILDRVSLKRQGTGEEIAAAVRFLIQDAGYITGQVLNVDGGRSLYS